MRLAAESGHSDTARLLAGVVEVLDVRTGTVRLRADADAAGTMALDARRGRTVPVGRRVRYELADPRLAGALAQLASLVLVVTAGTAGEPCGPEDYACDSAPVLAEMAPDGLPAPVGAPRG